MYTDDMTATCLGLTVEQYRAAYKGAAGREQNRMAIHAIRQALSGNGKGAAATLKARDALTRKAAK
jgi:hypothetical protein